MNLLELQTIISKKMSTIDYIKLWPNFKQYKIALYDDQNVYMNGSIFPKTSLFIGNTSILYQNEHIGIWYITKDIDKDVLTSKLIHETFHAFQAEHNESRYPNELTSLLTYQYRADNLSIKRLENNLIVTLIDLFDEETFRQLIELRSMRKQFYPVEYEYESRIEQIEGLANYIELESLKQLNVDLYEQKLTQMKHSILDPKNLIPIRIISYDIGALLIKIIVTNKLGMNDSFSKTLFFDPFLCKPSIPIPYTIDTILSKLVTDYHEDLLKVIEYTLATQSPVLSGHYKLLGLNVYDAKSIDGYILTTYFFMYEQEGASKLMQGNYLLKMTNELFIQQAYALI